MSEAINLGISLIIPSRAQSNWDALLRTAFEAISSHDHSGGGAGVQITSASLAANGVDDTLIRLRNGVTNGLRIRNQGNTADVVAISLSNADKIRFTSSAVSSDTRADLGVAIGGDVQAYDADLSAIAALSPSNDDLLLRAGGAWTAGAPAAVRTALGLVVGTNVQAYDADLTTLGALGSGARSALGLAIGGDVQAYDPDLAAIAALVGASGNILYHNGSAWTAQAYGDVIVSLLKIDRVRNDSNGFVIGWNGADKFTCSNNDFLPTVDGGMNIGSNSMSMNGVSARVFNWSDGAVTSSQAPQTDAAQGFLTVQVDGTEKRVPYYAV